MEDEAKKKRNCFVITPIGKKTDPIRRHIDGIIDACIIPELENDYKISVAHRLPNPGSINKQVIKLIYESDLVIANLTNKNPNVMYELAIRYCIGTPAIIIAESGTDLPFDIIEERTIFYTNDAQGVIDLRKDLKKALSVIDYSDKVPRGPIYDNLRKIDKEAQIIKEINVDDGVKPIKYILDRLDDIQNSLVISQRSKSNLRDLLVICELEEKSKINELDISKRLFSRFDMTKCSVSVTNPNDEKINVIIKLYNIQYNKDIANIIGLELKQLNIPVIKIKISDLDTNQYLSVYYVD